MIRPIWKLISVFLALALFTVVGGISLSAGEDLIWVVGKAMVAFLISWMVLGFLGNVLIALLEKQDVSAGASEHETAREASE